MTFRRALKAAAIGLCLCGVLPTTALSQTDISIPEAQRLAFGLIDRGQPAAALELINALQADGRNQTAALFIARSRAERALGDYDAALASGRTAFSLTRTDGEKFLAARIIAQALASDDRRSLAQFWLRRAAQFAPDERTYAIARRDFSYVQSRNPISYALNFSAHPTDNINNAPRDNTYELLGFIFSDPTAVPISGTRIQTAAELTYRLPATERRTSELTLSYQGRRVLLGSEAAVIDPSLAASDLASDRLTATYALRFLQPDNGNILDTSLDFYADWAGGTHIQNGARARIGYTWQLAERTQSLRVGLVYDDATRLDNELRSYQSTTLETSWSANLDALGFIQISGAITDVESSSFAVARSGWTVSAHYTLPDPIWTADVSFGYSFGQTEYDEPLYTSARREDDISVTSIRAAINSVEVMGFNPVVELSRQRVRSNVTLFDTESNNVSVSFQSKF